MNQWYEGYENEWVRCDYSTHRAALRDLGVESIRTPIHDTRICRRGDLRAANVLVVATQGRVYSIDIDALERIQW